MILPCNTIKEKLHVYHFHGTCNPCRHRLSWKGMEILCCYYVGERGSDLTATTIGKALGLREVQV
ncbi:BnaA05g15970D [Brassica napus]|uniref:BnaA05g15970D protein n=1 Tax=Brassica napus TaxID=3708 RepID=A0A078GS70_BRANA|nr:BnaA05g15970D [Brassica napus]